MTATLLALFWLAPAADLPKVEPLWPKAAPGAVGTEDRDTPTLTAFLPPVDKANGTAVVVCPGGGYGGLASTYEGNEVAAWLAQQGVAGFVLKYRHAPRYRHPAPLQDAQRAIRILRARAGEYHLNLSRIGIMGFSAGGHLASTAATHFDAAKSEAKDPIEHFSSRPDFAILCYPVITLLPPAAHMGSRYNLLGKEADEKLVESLCNERMVTSRTPPTFLFHTDSDATVSPENSVLFYAALKKANIPAEMHIYAQGPHGVGLALKDPILSTWPALLTAWLKGRGLLDKK